ncbi:hypothetical protein CesoFtcFv8_011686 [Champsocephalus esox]|uniref:Uncharacterized protein n=1 Tax=Champsocephalus esox TaxID=159716 RepID=A0AAN8C4Q9_9TELE|nr:hypothetical protein CesoFtcFv8_011686 [Champsocephalus esox]
MSSLLDFQPFSSSASCGLTRDLDHQIKSTTIRSLMTLNQMILSSQSRQTQWISKERLTELEEEGEILMVTRRRVT